MFSILINCGRVKERCRTYCLFSFIFVFMEDADFELRRGKVLQRTGSDRGCVRLLWIWLPGFKFWHRPAVCDLKKLQPFWVSFLFSIKWKSHRCLSWGCEGERQGRCGAGRVMCRKCSGAALAWSRSVQDTCGQQQQPVPYYQVVVTVTQLLGR